MTLLFRVVFFVSCIFLITAQGYGQSLTLQNISPSVTDVLISSNVNTSQRTASVDVHENSGITVYTWTEPDDIAYPTGNRNIFCAIYDKAMNVLQPAFRVNLNTTGDQIHPAIKINQLDNTFIVAWASNHIAVDGNYDIFAKRMSLSMQNSAVATALADNIINSYTSYRQLTPRIAYDYTYDEVFIAWRDSDGQDGSGLGVYGRRVSNTNFPAFPDGEFVMNDTKIDHQIIYDLEVSPVTGALYVLYSSLNSPSNYDIYQRRFNRTSTGSYTAVNEVRLNTTTAGTQWNPSFKFNTTTGAYSAGWTSDGQDGSGRGVYFRVFDKTDASLLAETRASIPTTYNQYAIRSAWDEESGYLMHFYLYFNNVSTTNLKYQLFDNTYAPYGSETDALSGTNIQYTEGFYHFAYNKALKNLHVNYTIYNGQVDQGIVSARYFKYSHPSYTEPTCSTDNSKNWTSQILYDQNGQKIEEQRTYSDQLGRTLQVQTKDFENKNILATAILYDKQGNAVIQTLPATITSQCFAYKNDFVSYQTGGSTYAPYTFNQFDAATGATGGWDNPTQVSNNTGLGLYYSNSNTAEPYAPVSTYPYFRTYYNNMIAGGVLKSANAGEELRMGRGKEVKSFTAPILNELNHYMALRNTHFVQSGSSQTTMAYQGTKTFSTDENGVMSVLFKDISGNQLAKAIVDGSVYTPIVASIAPSSFYYYNFDNTVGSTTSLYIVSPQDVVEAYNFTTSSTIAVTYDVPLTITAGHIIQIRSKGYFTLSTPNSTSHIPVLFQNPGLPSAIDAYINNAVSFTITAAANDNISIINAETGTVVYSGMKSGFTSLPTSGYYRIRIKSFAFSSTYSANVSVGYSFNYSNVSYYFYDNAGRQVAEVAPNSLIPVSPNGINSIATSNPIFKTTYVFNTFGAVITKNSLDAGVTNFVYRKDGNLRFTQNAKQAVSGKFSFTNYDISGRVIESGEYDNSLGSSVFQTHQAYANSPNGSSVFNVLESNEVGGGFGISCPCLTQKNNVSYDINSPSFPVVDLPYARTQKFLQGKVSKTSNDNNTTWYSYDELGRIEWTVQFIIGLDTKTTDYQYDLNGNVIKVIYQDAHAERFEHRYTYDRNQRLKLVETKAGNVAKPYQLEEKLSYYMHGPVKRRELAVDLQGIDYTYTIQGWLKSINSPQLDNTDPGKDNYSGINAGFANDAFGLLLEYFNPTGFASPLGEYGQYDRCDKGLNNSVYTVSGVTNRYDGTIKAMRWKTRDKNFAGSSNALQYVFEYDRKNQLKNATFGTVARSTNNCSGGTDAYYQFTANSSSAFKVNTLNYDANGNILNKYAANEAGTYNDKFDYNYTSNTNKLASVQVNGTATYYAQYQYNEIGQLKQETKGSLINVLEYDVYQRTTKVTETSTGNKILAEFAYNERGNRIKKKTYNASGTLLYTTYYVNDVLGNVLSIYDDNDATHSLSQKEIPIYGQARIGVANKTTTYTYNYELKDHLGNVRAVVSRNKVAGQAYIYSWTDYYPHGALMPGRINNPYRNDYQSDYAEKDPETGYNTFDLRMYDASIGRWLSTDPMEQYWSPYMAMGNNPVSTVDPSGGYDDNDPANRTGVINTGNSNSKLGSLTQDRDYAYAMYSMSMYSEIKPPNSFNGFTGFNGIGYTGTLGNNGNSSSIGNYSNNGTSNYDPQGTALGYLLINLLNNWVNGSANSYSNNNYNNGHTSDPSYASTHATDILYGGDAGYNPPPAYAWHWNSSVGNITSSLFSSVNGASCDPTTVFNGASSNNVNTLNPSPIIIDFREYLGQWLGEVFNDLYRPDPSVRSQPIMPGPSALSFGTTVITVTSNGLRHVLLRHTINGIQKYLGKSKFLQNINVTNLIKSAQKVTPKLQPNGNYERIVDAGKVIGYTKGKATTIYTVITDQYGKLVTAFPGTP